MPTTIYISSAFAKRLIAQNLKLWQDNEKKYGVWSGIPDRYSIQFNPTTGEYKSAYFDMKQRRTVDREPGWETFMLPVPQNEYELMAAFEEISAGRILRANEYIGEFID